MDLIEMVFKGLAKMSSGDNKLHVHKGKDRDYLKLGDDSRGRLGRTLLSRKKKK